MSPPSLPFAGIRIVQFRRLASGPGCGMRLADCGVEVIAIEPPAGDSMRRWPPVDGGSRANFASVGRGKRSVPLNFEAPRDLDRTRAPKRGAEALAERVGIDRARLRATSV